MHRIITFLLALVLLFGSCLNENSLHTFGSNANAESQYETLKPGSKGQAVLDARMRLYELGYFTKVPTQTDYTNNMTDYVKKFEKDYGLNQDGILSPEDQEVLFGNVKDEDAANETASKYTTLRPGSKGQAVLDARMRLYELGYFTKVPTQTEYTTNMMDYVKKFEKDYGLKQDGILSPEDQEALYGPAKVTTAEEIEYDFKQFRWGDSKKQVRAIEGKPDWDTESGLLYETQAVGLNVYLSYIFGNEGLFAVIYSLVEEHNNAMYYIKDYEEFKKALTKKYGEPFYDGEEWLNDSLKKYYEDDKGRALEYGYVTFTTIYLTDRSWIFMQMIGDDNYEVDTQVMYLNIDTNLDSLIDGPDYSDMI